MSPADARASVLASEIERDWSSVLSQLARAKSVDPEQGAPQAALVAFSLHHAYQAFESLLLRLERGLGLPERSGDNWHNALLQDAKMPIEGVRPAVFPSAVAASWQELLRFRHFLRHAYSVDFDVERLRRNVERLEEVTSGTEPQVQDLVAAIRT